MFNIGFGELAIICIVLIIAVGPERLPSMMKTLGKTIRTLRQASRDIRASTGIDELLREDFDLYSPPSPPRRPAFVPQNPDPIAPAPVSRQDPLEPPPAAPATEASSPGSSASAEAPPAAPSEPGLEPAVVALIGGAAPQNTPTPTLGDSGEPLPVPEPAHPGTAQAPASPEPAHDEPPKQPGS